MVDLTSAKNENPRAQTDYKVLGVLGLVHKGCLDYKILVMSAWEAAERGINSLEDLKAKE